MTFEDQDKEESGWQLYPLNGDTGHTYMGIKGNQKMFFKRNMTPFTAALSTEHIAPRLVWTKRLSNGDILTAQEWSDGRTLRRDEMGNSRVVELLQHVHHSKRLLHILEQIGGHKYLPVTHLNKWMEGLPKELFENKLVQSTYESLALNLPETDDDMLSVCHGDINHKNWLLADDDSLYLVDWDNAIIADPLFDVGALFSQYVPQGNRKTWLEEYGIAVNESVKERCEWYAKFSILRRAKRHALTNDTEKLKECLIKLENNESRE